MSNKENVQWIDDTIPFSAQFEDTYYSKADGFAETKHTFIDGNNLAERFKDASSFTIAELGFGTGLNFIATKILWQQIAPKTSKLSFISFEQYPMTADEIIKSLSRWPELNNEATALVGNWDYENTNFKTTIGNVNLEVYFSDANAQLPTLDLNVDAWILDGFSPAKNPELWNEELMLQVGRVTKQNGTFATYTSAGFVRRNLAAAGFDVTKVKGHATKREMSIGTKSQ